MDRLGHFLDVLCRFAFSRNGLGVLFAAVLQGQIFLRLLQMLNLRQ
jgi:hypothetical protein